MLNRWISLLAALMLLASCASAEGWMNSGDVDAAVDVMNEDVVYDAADSVGDVVNGGNPDPDLQQQIAYSFTPVEVVLVLDISGLKPLSLKVEMISATAAATTAAAEDEGAE